MGNTPQNNDNRYGNPKSDFPRTRKPTPSHWQGCLLGMAIGDAIGAKVEGQPNKQCREHMNELSKVISRNKLHELPSSDLKRLGTYTDDTQLTRELFISLNNCSNIMNVNDFGERIANLYRSSSLVGCGLTTAKALTRLCAGINAEDSGVLGTGNSPVLRSIAIGLFFSSNDLKPSYSLNTLLITAAKSQSAVTHTPRIVGVSAIVSAYAMHLALICEPVIPAVTFMNLLIEYVSALPRRDKPSSMPSGVVWKTQEDTMMEYLQILKDTIIAAISLEKAALILGALGTNNNNTDIGISCCCVSTLVWGLYTFLSSHSFWEVLSSTVEVGGDTDSTAAFACALAGAHYGVEPLPAALVDLISDENGSFNSVSLCQLANEGFACHESFLSRQVE